MHSRTKKCVTCVSVCNTDVASFVSVYIGDSVNVFNNSFQGFLHVSISLHHKKCRKGLLLFIAFALNVCKLLPREEGIDGGWEVIANALAWFESRASLQFRRVPGARPLLLMGGWIVGWQVSTKG